MRKVIIHYHTGDQVITFDAPFAETKHPRGQPKNAGQFASVPKHLELAENAPLEMKLVHAKATNLKTTHEKKIESLKNVQGFAKWSKGAKAHAAKWLEHLEGGSSNSPAPKPPTPKHEPEVIKATTPAKPAPAPEPAAKSAPEPKGEKQEAIADAMKLYGGGDAGKNYLKFLLKSPVLSDDTEAYVKKWADHLGFDLNKAPSTQKSGASKDAPAKWQDNGTAAIPAHHVNLGAKVKSQVKADQSLLRIQNIQRAMANAKGAPNIASPEAQKLCPTANMAWWQANTTERQRASIKNYCGKGYEGINGALRNLDTASPAMIARVNDIDELFENPDTIVKEDTIVHRAEGVTPETISQWKAALKSGKPLRAFREGFTSASLATISIFSGSSVQFQILVRKGSRMLGVGVDGLHGHGTSENEVILNHGISMEIYEITEGTDGKTYIKMATVQ